MRYEARAMSGIERFVHELRHLTPGECSLLRRATGAPLSHSVPAFDLFTSIYWRQDKGVLKKRWVWLTMTLYSWDPLPGGERSFADAWHEARPPEANARQRHDARLEAILSAEPPALDALLLGGVQVLRCHEVAIAWKQFTWDLHQWCDGSAAVRRRWADGYLTAREKGDAHAH